MPEIYNQKVYMPLQLGKVQNIFKANPVTKQVMLGDVFNVLLVY